MAHKIGPAFQRVLDHLQTQQALADVVGVTRQAINLWMRNGFISAKYVVRVSAATGGLVSTNELLIEAERGMATLKVRREIQRETAAATPKTDLFEGA